MRPRIFANRIYGDASRRLVRVPHSRETRGKLYRVLIEVTIRRNPVDKNLIFYERILNSHICRNRLREDGGVPDLFQPRAARPGAKSNEIQEGKSFRKSRLFGTDSEAPASPVGSFLEKSPHPQDFPDHRRHAREPVAASRESCMPRFARPTSQKRHKTVSKHCFPLSNSPSSERIAV